MARDAFEKALNYARYGYRIHYMNKRTLGWIFLALGLACGVSFLALGNVAPLPVLIALKLAPTFLMCAWMLVNGIDRIDAWIFAGIVFSGLCDLFMALPGETFTLFGMASNTIGLVLYLVYFVRSDPSLDIFRLIPFVLVLGVFYAFLYPHLGSNALPVLAYTILYAAFLWRAAARLGDPDIGRLSQLVCFGGSVILAASDCVLALSLFGAVPESPALHVTVMALWWGGLFALMHTADIKTKARKARASPAGR